MESLHKPVFKWSEIVVAAICIAVHVAVFSFWARTVPYITAGHSFDRYADLTIALVGTVVAATLFSIVAMFVRSRWISYPAAFIAVSAPFLSASSTAVTAGAFFASMIFLGNAVHRIRKDFFLSIGFSVSKSLRSGIGPYFTVFALILSLFYLTSLNQRDAVATLLPRAAFNFTFKRLAEPFTSATGLTGVDPNTPVDDLLLQIVEEQLRTKGVPISQIKPVERNRLLQLQRVEIAGRYGITLTGGERVGDVFYRTATARIEDFLGPYKKYLPYISVTAFFIAFKSLSFPLHYIVLGVVYLLIKWLRAVKILKVEKQQIEVERLTL